MVGPYKNRSMENTRGFRAGKKQLCRKSLFHERSTTLFVLLHFVLNIEFFIKYWRPLSESISKILQCPVQASFENIAMPCTSQFRKYCNALYKPVPEILQCPVQASSANIAMPCTSQFRKYSVGFFGSVPQKLCRRF